MTTADNLRLLKAGDTMSGVLAMATNNITNVGSLSGATNSTIVDYIVSNIGGGGLGRVAIFSSNKVIQDGGVILADLAKNTGVLATFLTKTGGTPDRCFKHVR